MYLPLELEGSGGTDGGSGRGDERVVSAMVILFS
jgi:hypothetical protein